MNTSELTVGAITILFVAAVFAVMILQMRRSMVDLAAQRLGYTTGGLAGLGASLLIYSLATEQIDDAATWVAVLLGLVAFGFTVVLANLGADRAMTIVQQAQPETVPNAPTMDLKPGQRVLWSSSLASRLLILPAVAVAAMGVAFVAVDDIALGLSAMLLLVGLLILALSSINVSADSSGLRVKYGILPWPRTQIGVDQIERASVIDVRPMEWGGWGYRGTLKLMHQAAVVLRAGPGIRLDLTDGRVFVVTIDNPDDGVALLNAEIARLAVQR